MTIESETDRTNWLEADGEEVIAPGGTFDAFVSERTGETFNAAIDEVDGVLMVLATHTQVATYSITVGATMTVRGDTYRVNLIEREQASATGGLAALYLTPT